MSTNPGEGDPVVEVRAWVPSSWSVTAVSQKVRELACQSPVRQEIPSPVAWVFTDGQCVHESRESFSPCAPKGAAGKLPRNPIARFSL